MSAFYDRQQDALSGYTGDYCTEAKARVPVCKAEADWFARELAEDASARTSRIASRMADDKADMRARCTVDWNARFQEAARPILALQIDLAANGFDARALDWVRVLLWETLVSINQENDRG